MAHGGFASVILDEVLGTAANMQATHGAFTVSLTMNYKRSIYTPTIVLVRGKVAKKEGKKLHLIGSVEDKDRNILVEAKGLWLKSDKDVGRWTTIEQLKMGWEKDKLKL